MIIAFRTAWNEVAVNGEIYRNVDADIIEQLLAGCRKLWQQGRAQVGFFQSGVAFEITGR